jgi:hypothetical protein
LPCATPAIEVADEGRSADGTGEGVERPVAEDLHPDLGQNSK